MNGRYAGSTGVGARFFFWRSDPGSLTTQVAGVPACVPLTPQPPNPSTSSASACPPTPATAVVSEFRMANRILAAWAAQARRDSRVDYEVTFLDGLRLSGGYPLLRKGGKPHASLSRVIRRLFKEMAGGPAPYLVEG